MVGIYFARGGDKKNEVTDPLDGDVELLRHMARRHGER
jgi:hypothetical protein